ncbi:MAG: hypothetical protein IVW36_06210 [Dehalococcoidia bacterium]|nr:hypothetical protein [Dehalococcoidia bacterium]
MKNWLTQARNNWDALLAFLLAYLAVAIWLGPAYYFLIWWVVLTLYVVKVALDTPTRR